MSGEHLVTMVNDIANFFAVESDREIAIEGVVNHLKRYWDPRMRRQIIKLCQQGEVGLSELGKAAVNRLAEIDS